MPKQNQIEKLLQQAQEKRIAILEERLAKTTNLKEIDNIMKMLQNYQNQKNENENKEINDLPENKGGFSSLIIGGQNEKTTNRH